MPNSSSLSSTDPTSRAQDIASRCGSARWQRDHWQVKCPSHDDHVASLTVTPGADKVLLFCHAGCSAQAILGTLGLQYADTFITPLATNGHRRFLQSYDYVDLDGVMRYQTVRFDPKDFRQRQPDPVKPGEWLWKLDGVELLLYNLPTVTQAIATGETIYVVEGEKDVETLRSLALTGTCNPMGAGKWRPGFSEALRGATVVILPDNDQPGRQHAQTVTKALAGIASSVRTITLPGVPEKGDITDWVRTGGTRTALEALCAESVTEDSQEDEDAFWGQGEAILPVVFREAQEPQPLCPPLPYEACISPAAGAHACPWLNEYMALSQEWSPRSAKAFHEATALWVLSTAAAGRIAVEMGKPMLSTLFIALIADSTKFAKTTCAAIGDDMLRRAGLSCLLADDMSTPQALLRTMSGKVDEGYAHMTEDDQETMQRTIAFAGQRGWYFEEWGGMLQQMARKDGPMAEFHSLLRRLDDSKEEFTSNTIARGRERIRHPYIALLACATPRDLAPYAKPDSPYWHDGFWPRFTLVGPETTEQPCLTRRPNGRMVIPSSLIVALHDWHLRLGVPTCRIEEIPGKANGKGTGTYRAICDRHPLTILDIPPDVFEAYNVYNEALMSLINVGDVTRDLYACYGRLHEKAMRVAMLLASFADAKAIGMAHWARAQQIVERWRYQLHAVVGNMEGSEPESRGSALDQKIESMLLKRGAMSARELRQFLHTYGADEIQRSLKSLVEIGTVGMAAQGKKTVYGLFTEDGAATAKEA